MGKVAHRQNKVFNTNTKDIIKNARVPPYGGRSARSPSDPAQGIFNDVFCIFV